MSITTLATLVRGILNTFPATLTDREKDTVLAVAIARAISVELTLPTSPVALVHSHYQMNFDKQVCDIINEFNEQMIIDTRLARDLTFKFYQLRYELVYNATAFMHYMPAVASVAPDFFSENVRFVIQKELTNGNLTDYLTEWTRVIFHVSEHIRNKNNVVPVLAPAAEVN